VRRLSIKTRTDIADWRNAEAATESQQNPRFYLLQDIYKAVANDALLSSQISNRQEPIIGLKCELVDSADKVCEAETERLNAMPILQDLIQAILDSELYGYSLVELSDGPAMSILPRRNFDPVFGRFFPDATGPNCIDYRSMKEYGKFVLEFRASHIGLLNKVVPHVLFKKFAQSCWSELCEIYGIPPRFLKTNTQDPDMLQRAEVMLRDMGSAAAFVIDQSEELSFASGVATNGDVYNNLITLCDNQISMAICGAIIGQDTQNGNYSKEKSNQELLQRLINSDKRMVELNMNSTVLPALRKLGWIADKCLTFRFATSEDTESLWDKVLQVLPYKDVDSDWLSEKFGMPIKDKVFPQSNVQNAAMLGGVSSGSSLPPAAMIGGNYSNYDFFA